MIGYSFEGATNKLYDYVLLPWRQLRGIPMQSANYIIARMERDAPVPILIGEAHRLHAFFAQHSNLWDLTQEKYGASLFYIHAVADQAARLSERDDLILAYQPAMNDVLDEPSA